MLSQTSSSIRGGINLQFAYLRTCHIVVVASFNLLTVFHSLRGVAVAKSTGKVFFGYRKRTFPMAEMLNQFSCQWERQRKGKQRVFPRQRRLSSHRSRGGNWKQMEIDENFPPRHGSLASRAMVDVFKTFLLPEIKIRWHLRNEKRQTWALAARPPSPSVGTSIFVFNFDWGLLNLSRDSCAFDATQQMLDCFRHRQVIGTRGTEIDKRRKNVSIKLSADRVLDCLLSGKSLAVVDRCDNFGLD